jgi:hypothetical protein
MFPVRDRFVSVFIIYWNYRSLCTEEAMNKLKEDDITIVTRTTAQDMNEATEGASNRTCMELSHPDFLHVVAHFLLLLHVVVELL